MSKLVSRTGTVTALSYFGNIAFGFLDSKLRFSIQKKTVGVKYDAFKDSCHIGDSVILTGTLGTKFGDKLMEVTSI